MQERSPGGRDCLAGLCIRYPEFLSDQSHHLELEMKTMSMNRTDRRGALNQPGLLAMAGTALIFALGARRTPLMRLALTAAAGTLLFRGMTGRNPLRALAPLLRGGGAEAGHMYVTTNVMINRPTQELYEFWRDFENLPQFMNHLESVQVYDPLHSHWRAKAPAGMSVEWDAEVTRDIPGQEISWRALPGSDVENWGTVRFRQAIDGRGTDVQVKMNYRPPAGKLGAVIAALFGEEPQEQIEDDLQHLKQLLESGAMGTSRSAAQTATGDGGMSAAKKSATQPVAPR